jgi:hypothetical protein
MMYVIWLYFGANLVRIEHRDTISEVRQVCQQWWNADPRNECRFIKEK